ncbi:type IV toxin-antitoxin system AbiEi family antitoxin domain-containing protein [Frondihabitans australicus]|uniref:Putative AbiEi antitoxin of type IV toxin-antitoxin system n=1 Tax=Frondihabitans australicus TaxID=386892 RepID=A0A495ICL4_9MICO|nr:type IV toxin-antitoxin system AbiEi family antitoxin domain-containing protein [Frondihabitans australicus]RKR73208.1 putative AbiEi antitoxin of type IV toxin-antitoxin system [Frondihabitans australicus]
MHSASAVNAVRLAGGIGTSAQLVTAGVTPYATRQAVEIGDLVRVRRGFYAVPDASPRALLAVRSGGRLAGLSAAESFGLWGGWSTPLHLCVSGHAGHVGGRSLPATRGVRLVDGTRAIVHWNDDRRDRDWCWRVSVERCVRQILRWHDAETALAVVDTALTAGLLRAGDVERLAQSPSRVTVADLERCAAGAQSGVESLARQRLQRAGLRVRLQPEVPGVGHVDLGIVGTMVYVEIDGYDYHSDPDQFTEDRRRDAEARRRGFVPLRFAAAQVRDAWPWAERMVLGAVAQTQVVAPFGR